MMEGQDRRKEDIVFALDIGTRSVIGVAGYVENGLLKAEYIEQMEHSERAVVDGQIEDIAGTAKIAGAVKARLEERLGFPLRSVHIAAAGRVLQTQKSSYEMDLDERKLIEARDQYELESKAIQNAYEQLTACAGLEQQSFYCVGHSVIRYQLDGYAFSTLLGHRGKRAGVELISTFLPNEVVESLYTTMSRIGLNVASVTLEPIAAMNAVMPKELRLLNVALVDVGAGTSDIAIANNGSVAAYTMATVAGDEVTEQIMRELLVDFQMAEKIKFAIGEGKRTIVYTDILGFEYEISPDELLEKIQPAVEELAQTISERILEVNGAPPMAVFMVGGGSRTPGLCALVARGLGLDEKKVAIGGSNYMKRMVEAEPQYLGAEYATPIGIAITAMAAQEQDDMTVSLNGQRVRLMSGGSMTVLEALLRGGHQYGEIMGRSGKSMMVEVNGEKQTIRGGAPALAEILVNGKPAGVTFPVQAGDEIQFTAAQNGADAQPKICDLAGGWNSFEVMLLGELRPAGTLGWINGAPARGDEALAPGDRVQFRTVSTLEELLEREELELPWERLLCNGSEAAPEWRLSPGDVIELAPARPDPAPEAPLAETPPKSEETACSGPVRRPIRIILNGEALILTPKPDGLPYQFFDLLNFTSIDPTKPQGDIVLRRNGIPASYLEPIAEGDSIDIFWERRTTEA